MCDRLYRLSGTRIADMSCYQPRLAVMGCSAGQRELGIFKCHLVLLDLRRGRTPNFAFDIGPSSHSSCPSVNSTQSLFPEFDYSIRKFTSSDACASAGFRPHFKQKLISAE